MEKQTSCSTWHQDSLIGLRLEGQADVEGALYEPHGRGDGSERQHLSCGHQGPQVRPQGDVRFGAAHHLFLEKIIVMRVTERQ